MIPALYRACLRLYPRQFRERFEADMAAVFAERLVDARARGRAAFAIIGILGLLDVIASGARERFFRGPVVLHHRRSLMPSDSWLSDVRFALRILARSPAMTTAAVLAMALGLGASGAIFAAVDHVLLRPLPYGNAGSLVMVWSNNTREGHDRNPVSPADALDFRHDTQSFVDLQPMLSFLVADQYVDGPAPDTIRSSSVGPGMFRLLGRAALVGRTFDERANAPNEVVLAYAFWQRRYGGDRSIVGRQVAISGGTNYTVVGVMPEDFVFPYRSMLGPSGFTSASSADVWVPMRFTGGFFVDGNGQPTRQARALGLVGRLKDGASLDAARSDLDGIASRLSTTYPATNDGWTTTVVPLLDQTVGGLRPALVLLLAGAVVLCLMTLVNTANLRLAQAVARRRELAVRTALGASRWRLARQSVIESLVLAAFGGVAGAVLLYAGVPLLVRMAPLDMPRLAEIRPDARVWLFTFALTALSGVIVGVVPALVSTRRGLEAALRDGTRGSTSGPGTRRLRASLVIGELVLAVLITTASALLARSFVAVLGVDPGFRADHLLTFQLTVPARYPTAPARLAYYDDLFSRLTAIPGVIAAGGTTRLPLGSTNVSTQIAVEGHDLPTSQLPEVEFRRAVADYLQAMDIPLERGRMFTHDDGPGAPGVCVINQAAALRLFPSEDPVGRRLRMGNNPQASWLTVVGIVGDVRHGSLEETPKPELYIPARQGPPQAPFVVVRTSGDPVALGEAARRAVASIDPLTPIFDMRSMTEIRRASVSERRFLLTLVGLFGALALALAAVGVYGVMALVVSERSREVGLRLALGARPAQIVRLVLGEAGTLALAGIGVGLALAIAGAPVMAHSLFGIEARDVGTFAAIPAVLLVVALLAAIVPARRAMRVDPIVTLRGE
jgi:putative ABC transport system permease protein